MENINTLFLYFRSILTLGVGLYTSREVLEQLAGYLDSKGKDVGKPRVERVEFGGKRIFDVMVGVG